MRILYHNLIDDVPSSSLVPSDASPNYPIENIQNERLTIVWQSISPSAQTVTIDLGTTASADSAAILGHNLTSAATITISANSSDSWPGATTQTMIWNSGAILKFFTSISYRYWQFYIDDPTNTDGYLQVGRMWIGEYLTIDPSSLLDFKVKKKRSDNVIIGRNRQKFASIGIGWREFELSFPETSYTMIKKIEDMYDYSGKWHSIIFCNFDTDRNYQLVEPCYCNIDDDIDFNHSERMKFKYDLSLKENK